MRIYNILVVDDEPHVIDTMVSLLESLEDLSLDIYCAYSGTQAIEIMKKGKIDLLITDIQMPDITGIQLVDTVNKLWPICKVVFLTAHSNFNYAYEAIRKHVVSYILKSEDDEYIISEIRKAIKSIDDELNQKQAILRYSSLSEREMSNANKELIFYILKNTNLTNEQILPLLSILGFPKPLHALFLIYGIVRQSNKKNKNAYFTIQDIFSYNMDCYLSHTICAIDEQDNLIWIVSPKTNFPVNNLVILLSGMLGTVQSSCQMTAGIAVSFIMSEPIKDISNISFIYNEIQNQVVKKAYDNNPFVFTLYSKQEASDEFQEMKLNKDLPVNIIKFIKDYVESNIANDLSLMQLSTVTGYNSSYISDIFHKITGEKLSRYIARKKLTMVNKLLCNKDLTIEVIYKQAGFASRQYFNYFRKKETGLSPKKYRLKILNQYYESEKQTDLV